MFFNPGELGSLNYDGEFGSYIDFLLILVLIDLITVFITLYVF